MKSNMKRILKDVLVRNISAQSLIISILISIPNIGSDALSKFLLGVALKTLIIFPILTSITLLSVLALKPYIKSSFIQNYDVKIKLTKLLSAFLIALVITIFITVLGIGTTDYSGYSKVEYFIILMMITSIFYVLETFFKFSIGYVTRFVDYIIKHHEAR